MARVTVVKRAQQRYEMVPVIDEATGQQKRVPIMNTRTGKPKTDKRGREVTIGLTVRDYNKPKPMPRCGYEGCKHESREIKVGESYKWIEPHGRGVMTRHADCPTWNVWEYSSSLSARIAEIQGTNDVPDDLAEPSDATSWLEDVAQQIRDLAEEKRESASNIEEGFGHETEQSAELNDIADQLESWADDLEGTEVPDLPEPEEEDCDTCGGTGTDDSVEGEETPCTECDGTGQTTPDEPSEEQMDTWREEVTEALQGALDESPL